jgi:hypothetical protein
MVGDNAAGAAQPKESIAHHARRRRRVRSLGCDRELGIPAVMAGSLAIGIPFIVIYSTGIAVAEARRARNTAGEPAPER